MSAEQWDALLAASQQDWELKQALSGAQSVEESDSGELSEAELEGVTGGTIGLGITNFPACMPAGWVRCDGTQWV